MLVVFFIEGSLYKEVYMYLWRLYSRNMEVNHVTYILNIFYSAQV